MTYLVMDSFGHDICNIEQLRNRIDNGEGRMRIFRLCDLRDPKELFIKRIGKTWMLVDMYGNQEEGV